MPGVDPTPTYVDRRKSDVYAAAFEAAIGDGIVTEGERAILGSLVEQLEISTDDAQMIEASVTARVQGWPGVSNNPRAT